MNTNNLESVAQAYARHKKAERRAEIVAASLCVLVIAAIAGALTVSLLSQ